jgi:hypothetical protein
MRWFRVHRLGLLAVLAAFACTGEFVSAQPDADGGGARDAGGAGSAAGRRYFEAKVQPLLVVVRPKGTCAFCHQQGLGGTGPFFLGATAASAYDALINNRRLVGATAAASLLVTRGDHTGDAFCTGAGVPYAACATDEVELLEAWIALEAE